MTIEKQQCLLAALGLYTLRRRDGSLAVDGIPGPSTTGAIKKAQSLCGLGQTGVWDDRTEEAVCERIGNRQFDQPKPETPEPSGDYPWLVDWERLIRCQCGGRYCSGLPEQGYSRKTLELANEVGRRLGVRLRCTSGYRCPRHNAETPGASPTSCHMRAIAFDCQAEGGRATPQQLYDTADQVVGDQGGVGIYRWGIHLDSRGYRRRWDSR